MEPEATLETLVGSLLVQTTQLGIVVEYLSQQLTKQCGLKIDAEDFESFAEKAWAQIKALR